jgi:16S rRNA G966 N2-methylase RsmD
MKENLNTPEIIAFIQDHINDDPYELMFSTHKYPGLPMREIAEQIASRQKVKDKLPEWFANDQLLFPPKENLEQASSEITAKFKAQFMKGDSFLDLTGGTGIDTFYIAQNFERSTYAEPNEELCELATHNFSELGADIKVRNDKAEHVLSENATKADWIFIDPSRRDESKNRLYALADCVPNVIELESKLLNSADNVLIKVSPMIDIKKSLKQFKSCYKVLVVAVDDEVKELLLYLNSANDQEVEIEAWNLSSKHEDEAFAFSYSEEEALSFDIGRPASYLYEPNSSLMKAGAFKLIGSRFKLQKLHPNTHLYTSENLIKEFPGKKLLIKEIIQPSKKEIKKRITEGKVNVIVRNYPMGANDIKRKFKLHDGGDDFLVFCEVEGQGLTAIWCERLTID